MKKIVYLFVFLTLPIYSQIELTPKTIIQKDTYDYNIFDSGDIDGDGDVDLLTYNSGDFSKKVLWIENLDGNGKFNTGNIVDLGEVSIANFESMKLLDLDGDNDLDIVYLYRNIVKYAINDGSGNFEQTSTIVPSNSFSASKRFVFEDLNNDNLLDLILIVDNSLICYQRIDANNFDTNYKIIANDNIENFIDISIFDINNNGNKDIIVGSTNGKIRSIKNNGNLSFEAPVIVVDSFENLKKIASTDVNADNSIDILAINNKGKIVWFENENNNFSSEKQIINADAFVNTMHVVDADKDGVKDIICVNESENLVWIKSTSNEFLTPKVISNKKPTKGYLIIDDINQDNSLDIIGHFNFTETNASDDSLYNGLRLAKITSSNNFSTFSNTVEVLDYPLRPKKFIFADINSDEKEDIIGISFFGSRIIWSENYDLKNFTSFKTIDFLPINVYDIDVKDIDLDGDNDIVISRREQTAPSNTLGEIIWYENTNGAGNFSTKHVIDTPASVGKVVLADVDKDGDYDIIAHSSNSSTNRGIFYYKNTNGSGNFSEKLKIADYNGEFTLSDIDNDNDLDLISGYFWHKNNDGTFASKQVLLEIMPDVNGQFRKLSNMSIEDINGDGFKDIIVGTKDFYSDTSDWEKSLNDVVLYKNIDGTSFASPSVIHKHWRYIQIIKTHLVDLDNDGDKDILVSLTDTSSEGADKEFAYYINQGNETFSDKTTIAKSGRDGIVSIFSSDFDKDGDMDVLTSNFAFDSVGILVNNSDNSTASLEDENIKDSKYTFIYPNPTPNKFKIKSKFKTDKVLIYNSIGKLIIEEKDKEEIDISNLSPGIYFVKIYNASSSKKPITKKIIKG